MGWLTSKLNRHLRELGMLTPDDEPIVGEGTGDVIGPATAISGHLAVFNGSTGKVIADGGAVPAVSGVDVQIVVPGVTTLTFINGILTATE